MEQFQSKTEGLGHPQNVDCVGIFFDLRNIYLGYICMYLYQNYLIQQID